MNILHITLNDYFESLIKEGCQKRGLSYKRTDNEEAALQLIEEAGVDFYILGARAKKEDSASFADLNMKKIYEAIVEATPNSKVCAYTSSKDAMNYCKDKPITYISSISPNSIDRIFEVIDKFKAKAIVV